MDNLKLVCLLIFSISPIFIYSIFRFKTSLELLKDIRIERILHYFVVSAFGFVLFHLENKLKIQLKIPEILEAIIFFFTLFYTAFFAIATIMKLTLKSIKFPIRIAHWLKILLTLKNIELLRI